MNRWIIVLCGSAAALFGTAACDNGNAGAAPAATKATAVSGSADQQCLVSGSPWKVSTTDLANQYREVVGSITVDEVSIDGENTLTVTPDLHVTIVDETTTKITGKTGNGADVVVTQRHTGSTGGQWKVAGKALQSTGTWTGQIDVSTTATVDGRQRESPAKVPAETIGKNPLTYSCADGTLKLTSKNSAFVWLFN